MSFTDEDRDKSLKRRANKTGDLKKAMLKSLREYLGVVTPAADAIGINRETHYDWMRRDKTYAAKVEQLKDVALDFAESKLHQSIKNGSDTATIFYLKTQGKKRGYIERAELDINGQMAVSWNETKTYENGADGEANPGSGRPGEQED